MQVRDKMLYASSRTCLKEGLGKALFIDDYFFSEIEECSLLQYQTSLKGDTSEVLTFAERIKLEDVSISMFLFGHVFGRLYVIYLFFFWDMK